MEAEQREEFDVLRPLPEDDRERSHDPADALMSAYADGRDEVFGELYELLIRPVRGFVRRRIRNPERVDELVQEVMMRVCMHRMRFRRGESVRAWVFAMTYRLVIDEHRRSWQWVRVFDPREVPDTWAGGLSPEEIVHGERLGRQLARAIEGLPDSQRRAFESVRILGMSLEETAWMHGTTVAAVKSLLHRALEALRNTLDPQEVP